MLFAVTRSAIIELATLLPAGLMSRAGIHAEAGRRTVGEQLAMVHQHIAHHLAQVRACIAGTRWQPEG